MLEKKSGFHYIFLKKPTCCPTDHSMIGRENSMGLLIVPLEWTGLRVKDSNSTELGIQTQTGLGSPWYLPPAGWASHLPPLSLNSVPTNQKQGCDLASS